MRLLAVFALSITACGAVAAESNRRTTDWQADLVAVLVERGMTETAASICQRHFSEAEPATDAAARWAIRWSAVQASQLLTTDSVTEEQVQAAKQPVAGLLQSYSDHDRQLWLRTQLAMVDFAAAQHAAVAYAVAAHRTDFQAQGLKRISGTLRQLEDLEETLRTEISRVASAPQEGAVTSADLISLQQNLGRHRAAAYLLRSELFADRSQDAIASAAQAIEAADAILTRMQADASLRPEVSLLKAEAVYRSGDPARAGQLLDALQQSLHGILPPKALALRVRIAVEQAPARAAEILADYYGSDPATAPPSTEMDLARLRWLLERSESQESASRDQTTAPIADWLDAIERRGGAYARRRGEAETLQRMRVAPDSRDVRLLAAEAAKRLREGEAMAAADLLVQAARSAPKPEQAVKYARQAAAVFLSVQQPSRASEVLVQTARTHRSEPAAAKAHLQAALATSKALKASSDPDVEPLIEILQEHAALWPGEPTVEQAVPWLLDILRAARRHAEAARFLTNQAEPNAEDFHAAGKLWRSALRNADDPHAQQQLVDEATRLFADDPEQPPQVQRAADWQAVWTAALFGTRAQLQALQSRLPDTAEEIATADELFLFVQSLLRFRLEGTTASTLETEQLGSHRLTIFDAIKRLRADGSDRPREHQRLGEAMVRLFEVLPVSEGADAVDSDSSLDPFAEPLARVWAGDWEDAVDQIDSIVEQASPEDKADAIQQAATILTEADSGDGKRTAIRYWKRLAQGVPQGSSRWHQAKLAEARLLIEIGEAKQAKRVCQFVLLTRPPEDPDLRAEYEAIVHP